MTLYSFQERLLRAEYDPYPYSEYADLALRAIIDHQNETLAAELFHKSFEKSTYFDEFEDIIRAIDNLRQHHNYHASWLDQVYQNCIVEIAKLIDVFYSSQTQISEELSLRYDFKTSAHHFYEMGYEHFSIKLFDIACFKQAGNTTLELLEYAEAILKIQWKEKLSDAQKILMDLKNLIPNFQEEKDLLYYGGRQLYDDNDLIAAAASACKLGLQVFARKLYTLAIQTRLEDVNPGDKPYRLADIAAEIARPDLLQDEKWAREVFLHAFSWIHERKDFFGISRSIGKLNDPIFESELTQSLLNKEQAFFQDCSFLTGLVTHMSASPLKESLLRQAADLATSTEEILALLELVQKNSKYQELSQRLHQKVKFHEDYIFYLLSRYIVDQKITLEDFRKEIIDLAKVNAISQNCKNLYPYPVGKITPLIQSCYWGANEMITMLVEEGADMTFTNAQGFNALIACLSEEILRDMGEDVVVDKHLIFEILKSGVDIDSIFIIENKYQTNALREAAYNGYLDVIEKLHQMGADYEIFQDKGKDILLAATYTCEIEVLEFLLYIGCDASTITESPVFWNYNYHQKEQEVIRLLKKSGARFS